MYLKLPTSLAKYALSLDSAETMKVVVKLDEIKLVSDKLPLP